MDRSEAGRLGGLKGGRAKTVAKRRAARRNGQNGGRAKSEAKTRAVRENASRPRGRWANTPERANLERLKDELRAGLPSAVSWLVKILEGDPNTKFDSDRFEVFRDAASRVGMPVSQKSEVSGDKWQPLTIEVDGGLGWPGVGDVGSGGGGADGSGPRS